MMLFFKSLLRTYMKPIVFQDAVAVWEALLGEEKAPTVIVGHSMGGAIATWSATLQVCPRDPQQQ